MSYLNEHAGALADVQAAGASVSFVLPTFGSASSATVAGYAVDAAGRGLMYVDGALIQTRDVRLFFVPSTIGEVPALNASVTWGGVVYKVARTEPYAPDGTAIFSYVDLKK